MKLIVKRVVVVAAAIGFREFAIVIDQAFINYLY
jgi:hypothetical protein